MNTKERREELIVHVHNNGAEENGDYEERKKPKDSSAIHSV